MSLLRIVKGSAVHSPSNRKLSAPFVTNDCKMWQHVAMPTEHLRVGTFTRSLLIDLARSTGLLEQAGLEVEEMSVVSSPAQFTSLADGELDLVITSPDNVLAYRFLSDNPLGRRLPVEILAGIDRGLGLALCTAPELSTVDQVRGKTVGVDVPQSGFAFVAFALLSRAGLQPDDYTVESMGSTPRRAASLIAGECAATVLNAGNELRAEARGCHVVSRVSELGPYLGTVIARLATDDPVASSAHDRFTDSMLTMSEQIQAGLWEAEVVQAARRILDLDETEARAHHRCLLDPTSGLVVGGVVDAASIGTLVGLRRRHRPSPELDVVEASWESMVAERARARPPGSSHG